MQNIAELLVCVCLNKMQDDHRHLQKLGTPKRKATGAMDLRMNCTMRGLTESNMPLVSGMEIEFR